MARGRAVGDYRILGTFVAAREEDGAVYNALDADGNPCFLQHVPMPRTSVKDVSNRVVRLVNTVKLLQALSFEGLVAVRGVLEHDAELYLILDHVPGARTIAQLCKPHDVVSLEKAVGWARRMCHALAYLENQAMPFTVDRLGPEDVVVDDRDGAWLLTLRLNRIFHPGAAPVRAATASDQARSYQSFGRFVQFLAEHIDSRDPAQSRAITSLKTLATRCINEGPNRTFRRFEEVQAELFECTGPAQAEEEPAPAATVDEALRAGDILQRVKRRITLQPRNTLLMQFLLLFIILPLWLWLGAGRSRFKLTAETAAPIYVVSGSGEFITFNPFSGLIRSQGKWIDVAATDGAVAPDGRTLLLSDNQKPRVAICNTASDAVATHVTLQQPARHIRVSPRASLAFCVSNSMISVISLDTMRVSQNIVIQKGSAGDVAISADGGRLFLSMPAESAVWVVDLRRGAVATVLRLPEAPGPLAVSPDGSTLCVAMPASGSLQVVSVEQDSSTARIETSIQNVGGRGPLKIAFSRDGTHVYVLYKETASIGCVRVSDRSVEKSIPTGGREPVDWFWWKPEAVWVVHRDKVLGIVNPIDGRAVSVNLGISPRLIVGPQKLK